jgi:glycosyltransferase involved in cell wall biosynthesis
VYNDAKRIGPCIEALLAQTYPCELVEVLIADNGSTDATQAIVGRYPVTLIVEDRQRGSYAARNTAIKHAHGTVIAFTDSDCLPDAGWLEHGVAALEGTPNCGLVAGKVEVFFGDPARPTSVELFESVTAFPQQFFVESAHFGATANVFTYKSVIDHVGPFDSTLQSSGDREWGSRVHRGGYAVVYAPDARVLHPARSTYHELFTKYVRIIGGLETLRGTTHFSLPVFLRRVVFDLVPDVKALRKAYAADHLTPSQKLRVMFVILAARVFYVRARIRFERERAEKNRRTRMATS